VNREKRMKNKFQIISSNATQLRMLCKQFFFFYSKKAELISLCQVSLKGVGEEE
jgi:hypothetical protein